MSVEENRALVRRFIEEMMSGQHVDRIEEFVAEDAVHHEPHSSMSYREALRNVFGDPRYGWRFTVHDLIAEGDTVVARCTASYRCLSDRGPYGIPYRAGTTASVAHAHFFRVRDGRIVEHWPVRDIWEAVKQFNAPNRDSETATV
jgi:predicted ester cyclase